MTADATRSVGLVHDYLLVMRGAERTFDAIAGVWPDAPIYTTLFSDGGTEGRFSSRRVHTSGLQRLGVRQRGFRRMLPFFPAAVERLPLREHDIIVSSSSAFAHGVRPGADAVHVCYCHNPFRYAWHEREAALGELPAFARPLLQRTLNRIQRWDREASRRVTHYIANSEHVRRRLGDFYGRDATVIPPPVEVDRFRPREPEDYFVTVGELVRHKRVDVALAAARAAGRHVKVVGSGPERPRLEAEFGDTATFLGRIDDGQLAHVLSGALALIVPNVEEFGIAAVEAQAAGRPVIAPAEGGTLATVADGVTGVHLARRDADEIAQILRDVDFVAFDPRVMVRNAERYSRRRFQERLLAEVDRVAGPAQRPSPAGEATGSADVSSRSR